jgi:hypothetical protein
MSYYCRQWFWQKTDLSSRQIGSPTKTRPWMSNSKSTWSCAPDGLDTKIDWLTVWLTDRQSQCDFDFDYKAVGPSVTVQRGDRVTGAGYWVDWLHLVIWRKRVLNRVVFADLPLHNVFTPTSVWRKCVRECCRPAALCAVLCKTTK